MEKKRDLRVEKTYLLLHNAFTALIAFLRQQSGHCLAGCLAELRPGLRFPKKNFMEIGGPACYTGRDRTFPQEQRRNRNGSTNDPDRRG